MKKVVLAICVLSFFCRIAIAQSIASSGEDTLAGSNTETLRWYFPPGSFLDTSVNRIHAWRDTIAEHLKIRLVFLDTLDNSRYSKYLSAMHEPVIFDDQSGREIYRLTWLPCFGQPVAIRIEKQDTNYTLFWKVASGAGGYFPGDLFVDKQRPLDRATWELFTAKLNDIAFWKLPTVERKYGWTDGSNWILEGKTPDAYHVVDRPSPGKKSGIYSCGNFLIELTDLKFKKWQKNQ